MNANDLELKISGLEKAIQEHKADTDRYQDELKATQKQLEDYNKPELTPAMMDEIHNAIEKAVERFDFTDTDNFEIEYGGDYDGRIHCESHEFRNSDDLVQMIADNVCDLFKEAECPEELDTTEPDHHA